MFEREVVNQTNRAEPSKAAVTTTVTSTSNAGLNKPVIQNTTASTKQNLQYLQIAEGKAEEQVKQEMNSITDDATYQGIENLITGAALGGAK